jgi:hypothetical protein
VGVRQPDDLAVRGHGLRGRPPGVGEAVPVRGGDDVLQVRHARGDRPPGATGAGDQGGEVLVGIAPEFRDDLLGVGQRWHGAGGHERGHLHPPDAGGDDRVEDLQLGRQRDGGLQLQPVAQADPPDVDRGGKGHRRLLARGGDR